MTNFTKSVNGSSFSGSVKLSNIQLSGHRGISKGQIAEIYLNESRILLINLSRRTIWVRSCDE